MKRLGRALVILLLAWASARAETGPAPQPAAVPGPPNAVPAAPTAPAAPAAPPGMRIVTGQAPVIGGNAAGARERALDDAVRHAVELSLADIADAPTLLAQARTVKALLARARTFVPRYRTLEEGEVNGVYTVRLEAEVDDIALRVKLERPSPSPAPPPTFRPGALAVLVVAADRTESTSAFATALASVLSDGGVRARVGEEPTAASGQTLTRVTAEVTDEGPLRGMARQSISCHAVAWVVAPPRPPVPENATARVFVPSGPAGPAGTAAGGPAACLARLSADLAARVAAAAAASPGGNGDLRAVTVDADVVEPAVVSALLKSVRSVGAVSAAELTRVSDGHAQLRLRSRAPTAALAVALPRSAGSTITLSDVEIAGDVIRLRARLRPVPPPSTGSPP